MASDNRAKPSSKRADNYLRFGKKMAASPYGAIYGFGADVEGDGALMFHPSQQGAIATRYGKRSNDFLRFG